jgi:peptide/nickel transport system ATP-binding protein
MTTRFVQESLQRSAAHPNQRRSVPTLLGVRNLSVAYGRGGRRKPAALGVSFTVDAGETVAIVGESGSGKSTVVNAILKLLDGDAQVTGEAVFEGRDILGLNEREFRRFRGRHIGFVPQDPTSSLDPVRRIDNQIYEAFRLSGLQEYADRSRHRDQALALLDSVGLTAGERALASYPHQLSGGQLQRVLIGIAICQHPKLLVADEPTSALDVTIQKTILDLIDKLKAEQGLTVLLVTHDLSLASERAGKVLVLNRGEAVEYGASEQVLRHPTSAYAKELISDIPSLNFDKFAEAKATRAVPAGQRRALVVSDVVKTFGHGDTRTEALRGVTFTIEPGSTHALVGESGSGKSTLARIILRLDEPDGGQVIVDGKDIAHLGRRELREVRRNLQLVYQNPFISLDPKSTVRRLIEEPSIRYRVGSKPERREQVAGLLELVGLDPSYSERGIRELSGGQRQRVAIARALSLHPKLLILDEPTSALDVVVQAQILQVLTDLQTRFDLSYLFISHDLSVVRQFADTVTVLQRGEVKEEGTVSDIFDNSRSEYTRKLVDAIPLARHHASTRHAEAI